MVVVLNALAVQVLLQKLAPPQIFLGRDLLFPLEGRMGLRDKIGGCQADG